MTRDYVLAFEIYGGKKEGWRLASVLFAFEVRAPCNSCAIDAESDIGLRDSFVAHTLNITRRFTYYVGDTFLRAHAHTNETFVFNMGKRASLRIYNAKKFFFFFSLFFSFLFFSFPPRGREGLSRKVAKMITRNAVDGNCSRLYIDRLWFLIYYF